MALADDSGAVVEQYVYDPYGQTYIEDAAGQSRPTSAYGNPFMWTGQRYNAVTGLYGFTFRTYSPTLGRWLQRDPLGYVDGVNLYEYVASDPVGYVDPLGLAIPPYVDPMGQSIHAYYPLPCTGPEELQEAQRVVAEGTAGFAAAIPLKGVNVGLCLAERALKGATDPVGLMEDDLAAIGEFIDGVKQDYQNFKADGCSSGGAACGAGCAAGARALGGDELLDATDPNNGLTPFERGLKLGSGSIDAAAGAYGAAKLVSSCINPPKCTGPRLDPAGCFVAGTEVLTETGPKAIEDVELGDWVWSWDAESETWRLAEVTTTYTREYDGKIVTVVIGDAIIEATSNHPFWVISGDDLAARLEVDHILPSERAMTSHGRWVRADDLVVGDLLEVYSGQQSVVTAISTRQDTLTVYNLKVPEFRSYAVGSIGVLVHNSSQAPPPCGGSGGGGAGKSQVGSTRHIQLDKAGNGAYKIEFESGKGYAGKGGTARARRSARQRSRANDDPAVSIEHTPCTNDADAFAKEAAYLEELGGPKSPNNYNQRNSPGKKKPG